MRIWKSLASLNKGTGEPEIDTVKRISAHTFETHREREKKKNSAISKVANATAYKSVFNKMIRGAV